MDDDTAKLLGVFSTLGLAEERVGRARHTTGFNEYPEGFVIDGYVVGEDTWVEGFVRIDPTSGLRRKSGARSRRPRAVQAISNETTETPMAMRVRRATERHPE